MLQLYYSHAQKEGSSVSPAAGLNLIALITQLVMAKSPVPPAQHWNSSPFSFKEIIFSYSSILM